MYIIGIDPGVQGYIAIVKQIEAISTTLDKYECIKMPIVKYGGMNIVHVKTVDDILAAHQPGCVFIEAALLLRQANNLQIAQNHGRLLGCIERSEMASSIIMPSTWQSLIAGLCKGVIAWRKGQDSKEVAFLAAQCLFYREPSLFADRRVKDGLIDAVLIARYGAEILGRG